MDDLDLLYQTYLVTFATAAALRRTGNRARFSALVHDIEHREGAQRMASQLALGDAIELDAHLRSRPQLVLAIREARPDVLPRRPATLASVPDGRHRG